MGTLSREHAPVCNPEAVAFTMFLGVCLGVAFGVAAAVGVGGSAGILAFVAVSAFTLMCIRSKAHTANRSGRRGPAASRNGIKL